MKPNDKAYREFMRVYNKTHVSLEAQIMASLTAAYAAQFPPSEDYEGLVKWLRDKAESLSEIYPPEAEAADALEAVLAERDAWKGRQEATAAILKRVESERDALKVEIAEAKDLSWFWEIVDADGLNNVASCERTALRELVKYAAERDALAARFASVDDKALVEIAVKEVEKVIASANDSETVGGARWKALRAAIAAIRPHIEAAEREMCEKKLIEACELLHRLTAIIPGNDGAGEQVAKFLRSTAIRSGG